MTDYSAFQDLLDTYQSMHPLLQALWLLVPNLSLLAIAALFFRYRLIAASPHRNVTEQLAREAQGWERFKSENREGAYDLERVLRAEAGNGRMVAYRSPAPGAPVLLAYLPEDEDADQHG